VVDALAAPNAVEDAGLFVAALGRDQHSDRLSDCLLGRVAEQPLRSGVPAVDDALEVLADDCVVGKFDDAREPIGIFVGPLSM